MSDYYKALREMLRSVRLACGFSQRAVAEALGITRSAYTYYETGKTAPDIPALLTLASVFSLPAEAFLHPEDFAGLESAGCPSGLSRTSLTLATCGRRKKPW